MSASKNIGVSPKKGVNYFNHFPKAFLVPYGKIKEDMLTSKRCLEMVNTINCEWLLRPKYAISEMAETFTANTEVVREVMEEIDYNAVITNFDKVAEMLQMFNTKKNVEKPGRENVTNVIRHFLTPDLQMERMIQEAEKLGQALFLMANYHRVTQNLFTNLEIFAEKSQNTEGLDKRFKQDPSMANFTDYLVQSIVGTQVQATDMLSRRNLLEEFTRVEMNTSKRKFQQLEQETDYNTDSDSSKQDNRRTKKRKQMIESSSDSSTSDEENISLKDFLHTKRSPQKEKKEKASSATRKKEKKDVNKEQESERDERKRKEKKKKRKAFDSSGDSSSDNERKKKKTKDTKSSKDKSDGKKRKEDVTEKKKEIQEKQEEENQQKQKRKEQKETKEKQKTPKKDKDKGIELLIEDNEEQKVEEKKDGRKSPGKGKKKT